MDSKLDGAQRVFLDQEPSSREIQEVAYLLPLNKAPGVDSFNADGLRAGWSFLGNPLCGFVHHFWSSQVLPAHFQQVAIKLIPKISFPSTLGHWRPISLLSLHYKLIAKLLALRLAVLLPLLVPPEQTRFIKHRSTLDNIFMLVFAHESLLSHQQPGAFLKIDVLSSGVSVLSSLYEDDTALFLQLDQQSFRTVTQVLEMYCHATGAKVNFQKSELLPIGRRQPLPAWASTFGWKILSPCESAWYLGFQFSSTQNQSWTDIIRNLQNRVRYLCDNTLSFESRFLLMRHELSAVPNYLLPCLALTPGTANTLLQTYVNLLWGGNQDLQPKKHLGQDYLKTLETTASRGRNFLILSVDKPMAYHTGNLTTGCPLTEIARRMSGTIAAIFRPSLGLTMVEHAHSRYFYINQRGRITGI
ncbi:hypothetical protein R1sor_018948 [Riccia sorocarpa]|uniref:Reverse transcriptase domain-containing protein n=1 Tax=Riccia sorocarpa TaxID=122646 RepID=A0ABD3IBQ7_9MARC